MKRSDDLRSSNPTGNCGPGSFKGCQSQLMVFLGWGWGKSLQLALVVAAPAAVECCLWDFMLQPSTLIHVLRVPAYRLKESHQLIMQTQSKSQAEVFEVICYWKALTEVDGGILLLHTHTLILPWCKVITASPSTIPFQTSKCCSWLFAVFQRSPSCHQIALKL